jgi:hypothetical protein
MRKLEQFWFKYFSYATKDNEDSWVRYAVVAVFTLICAVAIYSDVQGYEALAEILFDTFLYLFLAFGITWIVVWIYHNIRLRK